jgi:hypothetical protein
MTPEDAEKVADVFQKDLSRYKFEQETQRDKALVLIAGGALTATFAFIASFTEHHRLVNIGWLFFAWGAWTVTLVFTVAGYSLSIKVYNLVINALSEARWADAHKRPRAAGWIEPVNVASSVCAVLGFALFGYFAYTNLTERSNGSESKTRKEESVKEVQGSTERKLSPPLPTPFAQPSP